MDVGSFKTSSFGPQRHRANVLVSGPTEAGLCALKRLHCFSSFLSLSLSVDSTSQKHFLRAREGGRKGGSEGSRRKGGLNFLNENSDALDGVRKKLIQSCCSFLCLAVLSSCAPGKNKMEKSNHGPLENRVWRILHWPLNKYLVQAFSLHLQSFTLVVRQLHTVP